MSDPLSRLVKLQDMDNMIRDATAVGGEASLGFRMQGLAVLQAAREKLSSEIPPRWLALYERLRGHMGRAVVPVGNRMCLGCFGSLPTSATPPGGEPTMCEHCGRILYW